MLYRADCADFGCHNSIRLETKHSTHLYILFGTLCFCYAKTLSFFFASDPLVFIAMNNKITIPLILPNSFFKLKVQKTATICFTVMSHFCFKTHVDINILIVCLSVLFQYRKKIFFCVLLANNFYLPHGVRRGGRPVGWVGRRVDRRQEKVCPGCISETVRCRKLILGRDIG